MNYTILINRPAGGFIPEDQAGQLGLAPIIPALVGAAPGIFQSIMGLFGGAGPKSGLPHGLAGITAFGNEVIGALNQIKAAMSAGQISPGDAVSKAQQLQGALTTGVYQAQKGKDAAALQGFKSQAAQLVSEIQSIAAAMPAPQGVGPNGQPIYQAPAATIAGIPVMTLMLFGGGALALVFILRK